MTDEKNLSQVLFSNLPAEPPETSTVANSAPVRGHDEQASPGWYRVLKFDRWSWLGIHVIESQAMVARIAMSDKPRTADHLLDTVTGYQPGNWCYEWSTEGARLQREAREAAKEGDKDTSNQLLIEACMHHCIASYPHLKGDLIATQALIAARQCYEEAGALWDTPLRKIEIPFGKNKSVQTLLHLPHEEHPVPLVIVSGALDESRFEYYRLFHDYLKPAGLGMLAVDVPGGGGSQDVALEVAKSDFFDEILLHMKKVPYVDHTRMAMLGRRLSGNTAVQMAFYHPDKLKAVVCVDGLIHQALPALKQDDGIVPQVLRDCLASHMKFDSILWPQRAVELQNYSLVKQGLLGRRKTPVSILAIASSHDPFCTKDDLKLLKQASNNGESHWLTPAGQVEYLDLAYQKASNWLKIILMD